jgi:hypothetical protein
MSAGAYMGAGQANALVGRWSQLVGAATDRRGQYNVGADMVLGPAPQVEVQPGWAAPPYDPYGHHDWRHHEQRAWEQHRDHRFGPHVRGWVDVVGKDAAAHQQHKGWVDGFRPRNLLVDAPPPQRAGREVLPMSVDGPILPTQSAQITARPQRVAFRPERVFISNASDATLGAAAFLVNDIKIGNRSQFSQSGSIPGDMFASVAIDSFVSFETAQTAMDIVMVVTYIGANSEGVPFYGAIIGTAAI